MVRNQFTPSDEKLGYAKVKVGPVQSDMIVSGECRIHRTSVSHPNREISHGSESGRWVNVDGIIIWHVPKIIRMYRAWNK